jgi:hypothetical protein
VRKKKEGGRRRNEEGGSRIRDEREGLDLTN